MSPQSDDLKNVVLLDRKKIANVAYATSVFLLAVAATMMFVWFYKYQWAAQNIVSPQIAEVNRQLHDLDKQLVDIQSKTQLLQGLSQKINSSQPATLQIAKLSAQLDSVQGQVKALNDAIGQSPDKAVAVPLLKKDMDDLRDSHHRDLDATQAEINRVYDQNKWFIGLMVTMTLALISFAVSNFLQFRKV